MTITHNSRRAMLFGSAVIIALSLLALTFATLHGLPSLGVSHTATHLASPGRMVAMVFRIPVAAVFRIPL